MSKALSWTNIEYEVEVPDKATGSFFKTHRQRVIKGISAYAVAGEVLAVMGGSGSGKTCTLDVLSFRSKQENTKGEVYLNNRKCDAETASNFISLVVQDDRLMPNLTVRETMMYAARLRNAGSNNTVSKDHITQRVSDVLLELELFHVKDMKIGDEFIRGLSGGQRRRVSIALQLLMEPQVLLLDEPTTGLDSTTAYHVMENLHNLAKRNRTVIASIHQPASEIFNLIDRILLLSRGRVMFFGKRDEALSYFSRLGHKSPTFSNPFDFFIDISSINYRTHELEETTRKEVKQLATAYQESNENKAVEREIEHLSNIPNILNDFQRRSRPPFFTTCYILISRMMLNLFRHTNGLKIRLSQYVLFAFMLWAFMGPIGLDQASIQNRFGYLYEMISGGLFLGLLSGCGLFPALREGYYREKADGLYSSSAFLLSYSIHAFPTDIGSVLLFACFGYFVMKLYLSVAAFFIFCYCAYLCLHFGESLALIFCLIFRDDNVAHNYSALIVYGECLLATGMLRNVQSMPKFLIDIGYICPPKYLCELVVYSQFKDLIFDCEQGQCQYPNGQAFIAAYYPDAEYNQLRNFLVSAGMTIATRLLVLLVLKIKK